MKSKIFLIVIILIGLVSNIFPQSLFRSGLFLHHSTGGVIWNNATPDVPALMHAYNVENNLIGDDSVHMDIAVGFFPPIEMPEGTLDNYWDSWHMIVTGQSDFPEYEAEWEGWLENYSLMVIKSCFGGSGVSEMGNPADTSDIDDDVNTKTMYRQKWHIRSIVREFESHPDKFFVIWTGIPLVPAAGYDGTLSHHFVTWMRDTLALGNDAIYGAFPPNVYIFDSWFLLAIEAQEVPGWGNCPWGMNPLYHDPGDNHPNEAGDDIVAPPFVEETFDAALAYESITPVELTLFNGNYEDGVVNLKWITATESNNFGFEVERRNDYSTYESIGFVNGNGTSTNRVTYNFVDDNLISNRYYYRLKQIDLDGTFEYSNEVMIEIDGLGNFQLSQNYPNPFNPSTEINFTLAKSGNVTLKVYNNLGSIVAILADGFMRSGKHSVKFYAKDVTSGVYFYRIETDNFISTRKMLLIK